jgi:prolyl oligopeptidase
MGMYVDPYAKYGQLTYELWRALRLVVDTGLHVMGWSRDEAIRFFAAETPKAAEDIVVEVDRYIVWPGQALGYKTGEIEIRRLRAEAERALGDAFDIRAFHDVVLGEGAVPLDVLAGRVRTWIDERLTAVGGESIE